MNISSNVKFETIILEGLRYVVSQRLRADIPSAQVSEIKEYSDFLNNALTYQLRATVYAENLAGDVVSYPSDWVEAFKERWFPKWLLKKYPVKYTTIKYDFRVKYPKFMPLPSSTYGDRVVVTRISDPIFTFKEEDNNV